VAGGNLWVLGEETVAALDPTSSWVGNFAYPKDFLEDSFACSLLHLCATSINNDKFADSERNGMIGVTPTAIGRAPFPALTVDPETLSPFLRDRGGGVGGVDVLFGDLFPAETGVTAPLYVFRAAGSAQDPPLASDYDGKICAIRWHDPDPGSARGRTIWFGFPMYSFENEGAQAAFNQVIDWFLEEDESN